MCKNNTDEKWFTSKIFYVVSNCVLHQALQSTYIYIHTHTHTYIHTYIHTHTHTHICTYILGSVSVKGSRIWNKSNTQNIQIYSVKYSNILQKQYYKLSLHIRIHLQSKRNVYVGIFLSLLQILPYHSWGLSHYVVNCWKFVCQHSMYFFDTR